MENPAAHVALVLPVLHRGGAERIAAELAIRLPSRGFSTSVICLENEDAPVGTELKQQGIDVIGLRRRRFRTLACARALAQRIPPARPLILHSHLHHANLATRLACWRLKPPARYGVHVVSTVHIVERRFRPWQFLLDRMTARWGDVEVCVSPAVMRFQQRRTGLPASFFRVIENGIDLTRFAPSLPHPPTATAHIVSVGRLNAQKDYPTLLRAWQIVEQRHPHARLTIAGEGPERPRLERLIRRLNLRRVVLAGFVADVTGLLQAADLYVQSSLWEGQPLSVIEAMATRLPIVVTDGDGLPETIAHQQTGLVVPRRHPPRMAEAILRLLSGKEEANRYATAAHEAAVRRFSLERMVDQYAALYRELLSPLH